MCRVRMLPYLFCLVVLYLFHCYHFLDNSNQNQNVKLEKKWKISYSSPPSSLPPLINNTIVTIIAIIINYYHHRHHHHHHHHHHHQQHHYDHHYCCHRHLIAVIIFRHEVREINSTRKAKFSPTCKRVWKPHAWDSKDITKWAGDRR